jgi:predicted dehydrogenase
MHSKISRRSFMASTVAATVSAASARRVHGANDRIRLGIIGTGGRGSYLMREVNKIGGIQWVAVCDAWTVRRDQGAALAAAAGPGAAKDADYRKLLERKDIDGVIVATWDNTHARITIDACAAGKDVYVEKPMTSLPMQGHGVVKAAREHGRIVQVGMQQRSMANFIEARQRFFDTGLIGKVHMVRTIWNANSGYLTPVPAGMERKPEGLDWDSCLGDLPRIPWDPKRYFNRFAYWDLSSGGQTGGLFVHMVDVVHWYLNLLKPVAAVAGGGIYQYDDGRDTPDNINLILEYSEKLNVTFEATITDMIPEESADIVFMGTLGRLSIFRSGYRFLPSPANPTKGEVTGGRAPEGAHLANWLECVKSRNQPNADAVAGHYSSMACHIGNIAYRQQTRVTWQKEWDL